MVKQITISKIPSNIDLSDIKFEEGKCLKNSFNLSKKYLEIDFVEGVIVIVYSDNNGKVLQHAWNKLGNNYFDVTYEKIWFDKEDFKKVKELRCTDVKEITSINLPKDILEFSDETNNLVKKLELTLKDREVKGE